jgi:phage portal protein BeeE
MIPTQRKPSLMTRVEEWAAEKLARAIWAGRMRKSPQRETSAYAKLQSLAGGYSTGKDRPLIKPTPSNLRRFSRTPYARRAINRIKNAIVMLPWEIRTKKGVALTGELKRQIEVATACFQRPNQDDSFRTMLEQVIEDICIAGAGALEREQGADQMRPLWMWPVDALSIQIYPGWSGDRNEARYLQSLGYGNVGINRGIQLRNDQLIYIKKDPSTNDPFGYGFLEVAFNSISRQLGAAEYAGNVASNGQPENLLQFVGMDTPTLDRFRGWWRNEIEGQGMTPLLGGDEVKVHKLRGGNDDALFLKYQEFLLREIATAFELSPQNLGVEADVNRNTSEVGDDRDYDGAITPMATNVAAYLTREAIESGLGFSQLEFGFVGLERDDVLNLAQVFALEYENNSKTPNEYREQRGLPPMESKWGDMTAADVQIAVQAAKGMAADLDPNLKAPKGAAPKKRDTKNV